MPGIFSQIDDLQEQINKRRPLEKAEVAQLKCYRSLKLGHVRVTF